MTATEYTDNYESNVISAGGSLSSGEYDAVHDFFTAIIDKGLESKMIDLGLALGGDLTSSLVKMVAATGTGTSVTNNNFTSGDYDSARGIYVTSNTNKYLQTGVVPSDHGLTNDDFSVLIYKTDDIITATDAIMMGLNNASGTCEMRLGQTGAMTSTTRVLSPGQSAMGITAKGEGVSIYSDFVLQRVPFTPPTVSFDSEITIFRGTHNGTARYSTGGYSFYWIGRGLDDFEYCVLVRAVHTLHEDLGRRSTADHCCTFGDSITYYTQATTVQNRWSRQVADHYSLHESNMGISGNMLAYSNGSNRDGAFRITDLKWYKIGRKHPNGRVFFYLAINDVNSDPGTDGTQSRADNFRERLKDFLFYCISILKVPVKNIVVLGVGYNTSANETKSLMYESAASEAAETYGVRFVTLYDKLIVTDLTDTVHYNNSGHAKIADAAKGV